MDQDRFDAFSRAVSRRTGLGLLAALGLGVIAPDRTAAKPQPKPCKPPKKKCGRRCVALKTDERHCGACNQPCAPGQTCADGACTGGGPACPTGQTPCGTTCATLATDAAHCGACGNACAAGRVCAAGVCGCPAGRKECAGLCIPTAERCCSGGSIYCSGNGMETCCYPPAICCFGVCCANTDGTSRCCNGKALCFSTRVPCPPA